MTNQYVNLQVPYTAEMVKVQALHLDPMAPEPYTLGGLLSTYWDGSSANPVIHPEPERLCLSLGISPEELFRIEDAMGLPGAGLGALEAGERGNWAIHYGSDEGGKTRIRSYQPLFVHQATVGRSELKKNRLSLNHMKALLRYQRELKPGLAKAMEAFATALTPSIFNDFGFLKHEYGTAPHRIWYKDHYGRLKGAKMQHNCQFTNKLIRDRTAAGADELIKVRELTDEDVADSFSAMIRLNEIDAKFLLGGDYNAIREAIKEINDAGWHTVEVQERGDDVSQWVAVFTPTLKFHQIVWDMDFNAPGSLLTNWERKNGFLPGREEDEIEGDDPMTSLPPLGYHYIYGISSAKTGQFVTVGQTTQSLRARLRQHERSASNIEANKSILRILADPTDHLHITHFATVHHRIANEKEISLAQQMLARGHAITNAFLTSKENARTVKLDSRFGSPEFVHNNFWEVEEQLRLQLEKYNGKEILFMVDSLPTANKELAWLLEPVADDMEELSGETLDSAAEAGWLEAWVAEETGAYSEYAA